MLAYVLRRLLFFLIGLLAASAVVFLVLAVLPGDTAQVMLGTQATPESLAALRQALGQGDPLWVQYAHWLSGLVRGDLGVSPLSHLSVGDQILQRLQVSGPLALMGMAFSLVIATPLGILAALRHRKLSDTLLSGLSQVGIAIPAFWAGIMLITLFAVRLGWLPAGGFTPWSDDPLGALRSLLLPAIALALVQGAILARYIRASVLEVMREDFIRTARAKGLTRSQALIRHGLRNAAIPVVTVLGLQLTYLLVGAIVIENVFFLPGLGRMLFQAIGQRDLIVVQGAVMVVTAAVLLVNFAVDISYHLIDPRLRVST